MTASNELQHTPGLEDAVIRIGNERSDWVDDDRKLPVTFNEILGADSIVTPEPVALDDDSEAAMILEMTSMKKDFSVFLEEYLRDLHAAHREIILNVETSDAQREKSYGAVESLVRIEDNAEMLQFASENMYKATAKMSFTNTEVKKFRSICRRNRIIRLDTVALVERVKKLKNPEFRQKILLMLNMVVYFITRDPEKAKHFELFVRIQFMIIKYAAGTGIVPTLASLLYEMYHSQVTAPVPTPAKKAPKVSKAPKARGVGTGFTHAL